jgi:predicted nucleic acid-binding protein
VSKREHVGQHFDLIPTVGGPQNLQGPRRSFGSPRLWSLLAADRDDHIAVAELRNTCRRNGLRIGTIDALLAQLCIHYTLALLTTDQDFIGVARLAPIKLWRAI